MLAFYDACEDRALNASQFYLMSPACMGEAGHRAMTTLASLTKHFCPFPQRLWAIFLECTRAFCSNLFIYFISMQQPYDSTWIYWKCRSGIQANRAATTLRSFVKSWLREDLNQTESRIHKTPWNQHGLEGQREDLSFICGIIYPSINSITAWRK